MEYVASYMLLAQNNKEPTADNIAMILKAIHAPVDQESLNSFVSKIEGKSYEEIMSTGASMMTLQSAASSAAPAAGTTSAVADKVEEEEEESESGVDLDIF